MIGKTAKKFASPGKFFLLLSVLFLFGGMMLPVHAAGMTAFAGHKLQPQHVKTRADYHALHANFEGMPPPRRPLMLPRRVLPPHMRARPRPPRARGSPPPSAVRIPPSQALRLAQRRWPNSIALSVRLLKRNTPVYAVKLKAGSQVVQVLVDAVTGMILR